MLNLSKFLQTLLGFVFCLVSFNSYAAESKIGSGLSKSHNELITQYQLLLSQQKQSRVELLAKIEASRDAFKKKQAAFYKKIESKKVVTKSTFTGFKSREQIIKDMEARRAVHLKDVQDRRAEIHKKMELQRSEMAKYRSGV